MADAKVTEPVEPVEEVAEGSEFPLSIEEFCSRQSALDKRVELLGAFAYAESAAGRKKDTQSAYAARYAAFAAAPA